MSTPAPEALTDYFWAATLQWTSPDGRLTTSTATGSGRLAASATRTEAWEGITAAARGIAGVPEGTTSAVLFFYLEPDSLAAGRVPEAAP